MALEISAVLSQGDPAEDGSPRQLATVQIGDVTITVYESLLRAGGVVIDVDGDHQDLRLAVNDTYVYDSSGEVA